MSDMNNNQNEQFDSDSTLFSAPKEQDETLNSRRKKNHMKKQRRTIIALAIIVAVALLAYFLVVLPIVNYVENEPDAPLELLDGEVLATGNRILMFEHYERGDIKTIEVHNEYGKYGFYYDETDGEFYVSDYPYAPYSEELFASLVVSTGYAVAAERVHTECEDMAEYGLDDSQSPAYYTLTCRDGETHTVYIGNLTPSGTGYYARYEGRDAVYVLDASLENTVLASLEDMITPQLALPMATNDYFTVKNFTLSDGKDVRVMITYLDEKEQEEAALTTAYAMLYPTNYSVSTNNYPAVLEKLSNFVGSRTVKYAPTDEELTEYGLLEPAYVVYYTYQDIEQMIVFSEKNEEGDYYAYSLLFDLIAELDADTAGWVEWDLIEWVDFPVFLMNINDVKAITVESDTTTRIFDLEGEAKELVVTERESGFKPEVENFREFYKTLLSLYIKGYVSEDLDDAGVSELIGGESYLTLTVETDAGKTTEYKFYPYSTRRAFYTVDGEGIFYILRDMAAKVIEDCEKVMTNTAIES